MKRTQHQLCPILAAAFLAAALLFGFCARAHAQYTVYGAATPTMAATYTAIATPTWSIRPILPPTGIWGWDDSISSYRPVAVSPLGLLECATASSSTTVIGSITAVITAAVGPTGWATDPVSIAALTASSVVALGAGTETIGSIGAIVGALPAGTNEIGEVGPDASSVGGRTAGSLPTRPFGCQLYLSDNSDLQAWLTAFTLLDGVNGQNVGGVAPIYFNGATWDRMVGSATGGLLASLASNTVTLAESSKVVSLASNTVTLNQDVPVTDTDGKVATSAFYAVSLATDAVTLLSSIASFTPPVLLEFQVRNTAYRGNPADSAGDLQANGHRLAQYDTIIVKPSIATFDMGWIADSAAVATLTLTIHSLAR
jgi:hypothetical protein